MRAIQIYGTAKKIQQLVTLSKQALRDGCYRVAIRLHAVALNMEGETAPEIADALKVHRSKVCLWLRHWQHSGMEGVLEGHRSGRPPALSERQRRELADILESGPVAYGFTSGVWTCPWWPGLLKKNFRPLTIPPMCRVSSTTSGFPSSVPRRYCLKPTKHFNPSGCAIDILTLKKNQKRRSGPSLRGRSQLPAGPHNFTKPGPG